MQSAGHLCLSLCYLPAVSAIFNISLFEFNDACMQSAGELKLHKPERNATLWVAKGLPYTDTWQYCLSETLSLSIYIYMCVCVCVFMCLCRVAQSL